MVKHAGVIDQIRLIKQGKRSLVFVKLTVLVLHLSNCRNLRL